MSRHYGRTELVKILGLLALSVLLLTLPGWAAGGMEKLSAQSAAKVDAETGGKWLDDHTYRYCGRTYDLEKMAKMMPELTQAVQGEVMEPAITLYEGPATEYVTTDEVAALLERCLEYVRDGDANYLKGPISTTLLYIEPHQTLKDDARDKLNALDRETKLRRDIEALIGKLRKGE